MRVPAFPTAFMYGRRRLTRLEVAIYATIAATLISLFLDQALAYMEFAEKTAVQTTLSTIVAGVNARVATDMLRGAAPAPGSWAGADPFTLSGSRPPNFVGDLGLRTLKSLERPAWTFDAQRGEAIYLPRLHRMLVTEDPGGALRFRLAPHSMGLGYQLVSTSRYTWNAEP